jgi:hypothetical protein
MSPYLETFFQAQRIKEQKEPRLSPSKDFHLENKGTTKKFYLHLSSQLYSKWTPLVTTEVSEYYPLSASTTEKKEKGSHQRDWDSQNCVGHMR